MASNGALSGSPRVPSPTTSVTFCTPGGGEVARRAAREPRVALDRPHVRAPGGRARRRGSPSRCRRRARGRPGPRRQHLAHARHHERLGDRLPAADRQRAVLVGAVAQAARARSTRAGRRRSRRARARRRRTGAARRSARSTSCIGSPRGPPAPRDVPAARRAHARGLLHRPVLQPHPRPARARGPPPARAHAGLPEAGRDPRRRRRGDRGAQAVRRAPRRRRAGRTAGASSRSAP